MISWECCFWYRPGVNFRRDPEAEVWRGEQTACATAAPPSGHRRHYSSTVGQVQPLVRSFLSIRFYPAFRVSNFLTGTADP
jgi:hypothetical protein